MSIARLSILVLCVAWVGLVGWHEITRGDLFKSRSAYSSSGSSCSGSFSSRYECRSSGLIDGDNAVFVSWGKSFAVALVPPLALLYLFGKYARRREDREAERVRQAVLKRKRAQRAQSESEGELILDNELEPTA